MEDELRSYRDQLILGEQKSQESYDKSVLSLSGGALAVSFAFLDRLVGTGCPSDPILLFLAWLSWSFSILSVLASFFFSQLAFRTAVHQVDTKKIYNQRPGRQFDILTAVLNATGGILLATGVILMSVFVYRNLGR